MAILNILEKYIAEAKSGDVTKSKKGKEVSVESGARGRERVKVGDKEFGADDKYTVKVKNAKGEVKEKVKRKAAGYTKYVDKKKEADKASVSNTKEIEKAKKKADGGAKKGGKKRVPKWWENDEEFKKVMMIDPKQKEATKKAIDAIRDNDATKKPETKKEEKKEEKPANKKGKKVPAKEVVAKKKAGKIAAESIYPKNPKAIQQIVEEFFNPEKEQVRNHFKK